MFVVESGAPNMQVLTVEDPSKLTHSRRDISAKSARTPSQSLHLGAADPGDLPSAAQARRYQRDGRECAANGQCQLGTFDEGSVVTDRVFKITVCDIGHTQ